VYLVNAAGMLTCPPSRTGMGTRIPGTPPAGVACPGNETPGPIQATFISAGTIQVTWAVTTAGSANPGISISIQYSANDSFANNVLVSNVAPGPVGQTSIFVYLSQSKISNNAVLQWIWQDNVDGAYYVGCSDLNITARFDGQRIPPNPPCYATSPPAGLTAAVFPTTAPTKASASALVSCLLLLLITIWAMY